MTVTNEIVLIALAFFMNYILIMNYGQNIGKMRRFVGATLMLVLGMVVYMTGHLNNSVDPTLNAIGFYIVGITVIYWIFQMFIVMGKAINDINS